MKIGIVLFNTPAYSETFFRSKIKGLQEMGVEVHLFCRSKEADFDLCPVTEGAKVNPNIFSQLWNFIREFVLLLPYPATVFRFISLERKEGTKPIDILKRIYLNAHLLKSKMDWLHFGFATAALGNETVAESIGAKMAVSFRGFDITVYPIKHPHCYNTLWKYVDRIHTISQNLLVLAKKHGLPDTISWVKIPPAIDMQLFQSSAHNPSAVSNPIFLTTGRLHWIKGYVPTLEALAILKAQGVDFTYKIIGDGPEYERLAFAAHQLGLGEKVRFMGLLKHEEVQKELELADIYLQYSLQEGFCNAVLEAQAMGKLCIVSDAEGLSENVQDEVTGWLVPKNNPVFLANKIRQVLEMPVEEKEKISHQAKERVRKFFTIDQQKQAFYKFYTN